MYPQTLVDIAMVIGEISNRDDLVSQVIVDSREATANCLFFALPGSKVDGHQFVDRVLAQGGFAVVKHGFGNDDRLLSVDDPLVALQQLAHHQLTMSQIPVVAVTGSNGKTSTKDLIAAVLSKKFKVHKTQGNYNNQLGLPLTILNLEPEHQIIVLEMGMRGLGEIKELAQIAPPDVAVITNVGPVHLELLGTIDNIAKAKGEILAELLPNGLAILNGDDHLIKNYCVTDKSTIYFGMDDFNHLQATNIKIDQNGCPEYSCQWQEQSASVKLRLPGEHQVYNSLAAIGVGLHFGINLAECIASLQQVDSLSAMRLMIEYGRDNIKIINDAYNASPASMESALKTQAQIVNQGRKVAVLGDMLELGTLTESAHYQIGKSAAKVCDYLIFIGQYSHFMKKGALEAGFSPSQIRIYETTSSLVPDVQHLFQAQDLVLVKASRGVALEAIVTELKER